MNAFEAIERIKNLQIFTITQKVPDEFTFSGRVQYDVKIKDGMITIEIPALDYKEAMQRADEFLGLK